MTQPLGFHHVALQARDVEGVARFYREHLGLPELQRHLRDDGSLRSIWLGARAGAGAEAGFLAVEHLPDGAQGTQGFSMVAFRIAPEGRAGLLEGLARAGVAVTRQTRWTVYVLDPEGNLVGLSHHPHDAPGV
jgi:catechol 2,3-dioxygenase-like lactoylglutathione lyase family enzyme